MAGVLEGIHVPSLGEDFSIRDERFNDNLLTEIYYRAPWLEYPIMGFNPEAGTTAMWYDRVTVVFLLRFLGYIEFTHIEEILQFDTESACWVPLMGPRTLRAAERLSLYQDNLSGEPRVAQGPAQIPPQRLTSQNARFWFSIIGPAPGTANIEQLLLQA